MKTASSRAIPIIFEGSEQWTGGCKLFLNECVSVLFSINNPLISNPIEVPVNKGLLTNVTFNDATSSTRSPFGRRSRRDPSFEISVSNTYVIVFSTVNTISSLKASRTLKGKTFGSK